MTFSEAGFLKNLIVDIQILICVPKDDNQILINEAQSKENRIKSHRDEHMLAMNVNRSISSVRATLLSGVRN